MTRMNGHSVCQPLKRRINLSKPVEVSEGFTKLCRVDVDHVVYSRNSGNEGEPRGFPGGAERQGLFVAANPVFAVGEQLQRREPLLQRDEPILKHGSDLERELWFLVLRVALPPAEVRRVGHVVGTAGRAADHSIGPAHLDDDLVAVLVIQVYWAEMRLLPERRQCRMCVTPDVSARRPTGVAFAGSSVDSGTRGFGGGSAN
jgi:hypothetical protein